ncbi:hypothetical protein C8Q77DRAFT_873663 [Trametes polyzona]|nr:hypothetical protein C8Q77DRAFT_873663 [Trametes polyzona]
MTFSCPVSRSPLPRVFDIAAVAFGLAYPDDLFDFSIAIVGTKVYSNSLLAMLNARESLAEEMNSTHRDDVITLSRLHRSAPSGAPHGSYLSSGSFWGGVQQSHESMTNADIGVKTDTHIDDPFAQV